MIMPAYTQLATDSFVAILSNADNLFHEVVFRAFQDFVHLIWWFDQVISYIIQNGIGRIEQFWERQRVRTVFIILFSRNRYIPKAVKLCAALTLAIGFLLYRIVYNMDFTHTCFYDLLQSVTIEINRNMYHDKNSIVLLIGQIFIDVSIPAYAIYW